MEIFIFGAGTAGVRAFNNLKDDYSIIGFIDNDPTKHGKEINGLLISPPDVLLQHQDATVFVASEFFEQIRQQLIAEDKCTAEQIKPLSAKMLAGVRFEHDALSVEQSLCALNTCVEFLKPIARHFHIDAGTLLGLYRDKTLIPWDDDMDLAIRAEDVSVIQANINTLVTQLNTNTKALWSCEAFKSEQAFGNVPKGGLRSFKFVTIGEKHLPSIDFFIKYNDMQFSDYCLASRGIRMPADFSATTVIYECNGFKWPIPCYTDKYLEEHYGDWRTPNPDWSLQDLHNSKVFG